MASKKWRKRIKRHARTVRKYGGRAASIILPIAGAIVAGPVGAAAGTALGTAASWDAERNAARLKGRRGSRVKKAGRRGIKAGLMRGGAVVAGAGAAALLAGGSATGGILSTLGIVGNSAQTIAGKAAPQGKSDALEFGWDSLMPGGEAGPAGAKGAEGGGILDTLGGAAGKVLGGIFGDKVPGGIEENPGGDKDGGGGGGGGGGVFSPEGPFGAQEGEAEVGGFSVAKLAVAAAVVVGGYFVVRSLRRKRSA